MRLLKMEIKIPEEMEVIGMFNTSYALMSKPRLTSIYIPIYNMGALAVRLLTKMLNGEEIESYDVAVKYQLMEKENLQNSELTINIKNYIIIDNYEGKRIKLNELESLWLVKIGKMRFNLIHSGVSKVKSLDG